MALKRIGVVDDHAVEEAVELFGVDAVRAFDFAVESGCGGCDVDVVDAFVQDMPTKSGQELSTVIGLDDLHPKRQPGQHIVHELDRGLLIQLWIDPQHP